MFRVVELLAAPGLERVVLLAGPRTAREVRSAVVIEHPIDVGSAPAGAVCLLTRAASAMEDYQLDMALRAAASADAAALAVYSLSGREPSLSARQIAERSGVALLSVSNDTDAGSFCVAVNRALHGGSAVTLERLTLLLRRLAALPREAQIDDVVLAAGHALVGPVVVQGVEESADELDPATIAAGGRCVASVAVDGPGGDVAAALVATAATRRLEAASRSEDAPIRSRAGVLAELLLDGAGDAAPIADRARALGIPVDGWHVAVEMAVGGADPETRIDPVSTHEMREEALRLAIRVARATGKGSWNGTQLRSVIVLVCTRREEPRLNAASDMVDLVESIRERVRARWPGASFAAGVGGLHEGPTGLQASAAEAADALATASADTGGGIAVFDATGLRRMLLAWSTSDPARRAGDDLLASLDALGEERSETFVRTLAVYLAEQGSLVRSGRILHLHRNAVAYRMNQIRKLLRNDLRDPDDRFALELACRARLLRLSRRRAARA